MYFKTFYFPFSHRGADGRCMLYAAVILFSVLPTAYRTSITPHDFLPPPPPPTTTPYPPPSPYPYPLPPPSPYPYPLPPSLPLPPPSPYTYPLPPFRNHNMDFLKELLRKRAQIDLRLS